MRRVSLAGIVAAGLSLAAGLARGQGLIRTDGAASKVRSVGVLADEDFDGVDGAANFAGDGQASQSQGAGSGTSSASQGNGNASAPDAPTAKTGGPVDADDQTGKQPK